MRTTASTSRRPVGHRNAAVRRTGTSEASAPVATEASAVAGNARRMPWLLLAALLLAAALAALLLFGAA